MIISLIVFLVWVSFFKVAKIGNTGRPSFALLCLSLTSISLLLLRTLIEIHIPSLIVGQYLSTDDEFAFLLFSAVSFFCAYLIARSLER